MRTVPHWVERTAVVASLAPVPSSLWRLPLIFGISMGMDDAFMAELMSEPLWQRGPYLLLLGVVSDSAAYLTLGLVRPWGERVPRWIPWLGGREVHTWLAATVATLGGLVVTALAVTMAIQAPRRFVPSESPWNVLMLGCYSPWLLWGPCLLVVTAAYVRRRRRAADPAEPETRTERRTPVG